MLEVASTQILKSVQVKMDLGKAVLESLKQYYTILKQDSTREGIVARKLFLECITGSDVCNNNFLSHLADYMGARKHSVIDSSKNRLKVETNQKLIPIVTRLERKTPDGKKIISIEWKVKAVAFFETDEISDVLKGHNNVFKVKFIKMASPHIFSF